MLLRVRSLAATISLPQLDLSALQSATFEHYNLSRKGGQARAEDVASVLEGSAREDWIQRREVDYLRAGIAAGNPELVKLMQESTSPAVKGAILETIYATIATAYPGLAKMAWKISARKKEELRISATSPPRKGVEVPLEIEETAEVPESPAAPTLASGPDASTRPLVGATGVEDELRQLANLQFLCLCLVNEYLVPLCEERGIALSPELQIALLENMLRQAYGAGVHKKVPLILNRLD